MAGMLPDTRPMRLPKPVARIYSQLKKIETEELFCRLSYAFDGRQGPEFFVLYRKRYVFLLAVSACSTEELEAMVEGGLWAEGSLDRSLELAERHRMESFVDAIAEELSDPGGFELSVEKWLLFPKASSASVERLVQIANWPNYLLLGREECRSANLQGYFERSTTSPLDELVLRHLQRQFSPEAAIPPDWVVAKAGKAGGHAATQTDFFLDYDQEAAVKRDLELSAEACEAVEGGTLRLITGVAGCGKTLVLLLRARMTAQLQVGGRILVLMHNKALRTDLGHRMGQLAPEARIEVSTFYGWIRRHMKYQPISSGQQEGLIRDIAGRLAPEVGLSPVFLREEFDWICDNAVEAVTEGWYLEVDRVGRQRPLQKNQRLAVYRLYRAYREALDQRGECDWGGIPVRFWRSVCSGRFELSSYDAIFIDEAQFFAPVWFALVKRALHPGTGQLFMVADPTQGFLRNGQSWQQILGREVRGRAQRLERPYRNTRQTLDFAGRFYLRRLPTEEGEVNLPDQAMLEGMSPGEEPRLLQVQTIQDERARVTNEVSAALAEGLAPGQILIIHVDPRQVSAIVRQLEVRHPGRVVDAREAQGRNQIRVCSLGACTGLEASVVIVLGLELLLDQEDHLQLDDAERKELVRANTKKIFVALTRAGQRLMVCYRRDATRLLLVGPAPAKSPEGGF